MINYEKCIELETLKRLITPEGLNNIGTDICKGCRHFPAGGMGACVMEGEYACQNRLAEWLDGPYNGWAEKTAVEKLTETMCDKYCKYPNSCVNQDELDRQCESCELVGLLEGLL